MLRMCAALVVVLAWVTPVGAQTMTLSTASGDYVITNVFSDVDFFTLDIEINAPLAPGAYVDPDIVSVTYQVSGVLEPGTPSGFPAFDLQRNMTGAEFYAQGSSLRFEIAQSAVLSDGVQAAELALGSYRIVPRRLTEEFGFSFGYADIEAALESAIALNT